MTYDVISAIMFMYRKESDMANQEGMAELDSMEETAVCRSDYSVFFGSVFLSSI